jgi:hypothetical protein
MQTVRLTAGLAGTAAAFLVLLLVDLQFASQALIVS